MGVAGMGQLETDKAEAGEEPTNASHASLYFDFPFSRLDQIALISSSYFLLKGQALIESPGNETDLTKSGHSMALKFFDGPEALVAKVQQAGLAGSWTQQNGSHQFRSQRGGVLSYWPGTCTVTVQGKSPGKEDLESIFSDELPKNPIVNQECGPSKKVFVVYGHDTSARTQLDAMLRRWGLEPIILDQLPSKGQTIIEKLEDYTEDVGFGVVLATPDDFGYPKDHEDQKAYRARQNVVLELGMLLVKLGRPKVAILLGNQVEMERPSDIQGLIYIAFKNDLQKEAGQLLAKEMAAQGYNIDVKNL
ncbi:TIR domain-containing protein [Xanthobacter aminoxidans]|uniref:TIR domain-containing protein n=1 Tax=Xanthobacter aminoxidans TaxID=186280 RepID=UPI00372A895B